MIDLTTGVPGSGKTYRIVSKIYDICTSKKRKYKHIFSNVNGLDISKCNQLADESDFVQALNFEDLKKDMISEFNYHQHSKTLDPDFLTISVKNDKFKLSEHQDDKLSDDILLLQDYDNFVKSKGIFSKYQNSLIIIDECHLYFEDKADDVLIRFLSYHRHFDIDIDLITQNKNLINKKYLAFIESMFVALPASKRFFSKKFRYRKYASYQEYSSNIAGMESLKLSEKVFTLYNSGSNVVGKSMFLKMFLPAIILSIITFLAYTYIQDTYFPSTSNKVKNEINSTKLTSSVAKASKIIPIASDDVSLADDDTLGKTFYFVTCFSDSCYFKNINTSFSQDNIYTIFNKFKCKVIINDFISTNYKDYIVRCNTSIKPFLRLFKNNLGKQNGKNTSSSFIGSNPLNR